MSIYSYSLKSHLSVCARAPRKPRDFNENAPGKRKTLHALKVQSSVFEFLNYNNYYISVIVMSKN